MERNTRQRAAILAALDGTGRALTPTELLALAQRQVPALNLSTIYRHLGALHAERRVAKVLLPGQAARYEGGCAAAPTAVGSGTGTGIGPDDHHHHHFQCDACEQVVALHGCPGSMQELAPSGFVVKAHELTLRGLCADCNRAVLR